MQQYDKGCGMVLHDNTEIDGSYFNNQLTKTKSVMIYMMMLVMSRKYVENNENKDDVGMKVMMTTMMMIIQVMIKSVHTKWKR